MHTTGAWLTRRRGCCSAIAMPRSHGEGSRAGPEAPSGESTRQGGRRTMTTRYEDYGRMERELAFKLLAAHAMVDADFFERLKRDPRAAAEHLHIALTDADVEYIQGIGWD